LVGHHPTNKLIGRELILHRQNFPPPRMREVVISGISHRFRWLSRSEGQITHVLLTRSPLVYPRKGLTARLACVKHAASVRPEPGSNSPLKYHDAPTPHREPAIINTMKRSIQADNPHTQKDMQAIDLKESNNQQTPHQHHNGRKQAACRLAIQINSSTFSTLLSSQRSNAHHPDPHGPSLGQRRSNLPDNQHPVKPKPWPPSPRTQRSPRAEPDHAERAPEPPR
jgi:hypothetical protein